MTGNLSNRNEHCVFLYLETRRIHPAAKREAHEYRTDGGNCLVRAWAGAKRLGTPGRTGLDSIAWDGRRARAMPDVNGPRCPELACCEAALLATGRRAAMYSLYG